MQTIQKTNKEKLNIIMRIAYWLKVLLLFFLYVLFLEVCTPRQAVLLPRHGWVCGNNPLFQIGRVS